MFERVLYPIDLTDVSITCARALVELRKYGTEELTLLHAVEYDPSKLIEGGIVDVDGFVAKLKEKTSRKIEEVAKEISRDLPNVSVKVVASQDPIAEISKFERNFDLLVIPSRSRSPFFLGRTTEKVVKSSETPCLVLKSRPEAGKSYYELILRSMFEKPAFIVEKTVDPLKIPELLKSLKQFGLKKVALIRVAELEEALEGKVSKEELIHPLVPIPKIVEFLSEYWDGERTKLEKICRDLNGAGVSSEVLISFSSVEKCLERISKVEGLSLVICGKQSFEKALKVSDAVLVFNF